MWPFRQRKHLRQPVATPLDTAAPSASTPVTTSPLRTAPPADPPASEGLANDGLPRYFETSDGDPHPTGTNYTALDTDAEDDIVSKQHLLPGERWATKRVRSVRHFLRSAFRTSSRVREFRLPLTAVFGGPALVSLLLCAGLGIVGVDLALNLTIIGLLLAVLIPTGIEVRKHSGRPRRVWIVDYRVHQYGQAVARGAERVLYNDKRQWLVERKPPTGATSGPNWQIETIQKAIIEDVDGLLLLPATGDEDQLWLTLASAIKSGRFVVVADTKPPNKIFRELLVEPPRFVSSRYSETGVIIGKHLHEWLSEGPDRTCILWTGPHGSWPGEERSRNILFELARHKHLDQIKLCQLKSWTPEPIRCYETIKLVEQAPPGLVAVYCADDENALALHLWTQLNYPGLRARMYIIGCNGTPDEQGEVQVLTMGAANVTVDISAEQQGVQAATLFIKERNSKLLPGAERSVFTPPKLLLHESKEGWKDALKLAPPYDDSSHRIAATAQLEGNGSPVAGGNNVRDRDVNDFKLPLAMTYSNETPRVTAESEQDKGSDEVAGGAAQSGGSS